MQAFMTRTFVTVIFFTQNIYRLILSLHQLRVVEFEWRTEPNHLPFLLKRSYKWVEIAKKFWKFLKKLWNSKSIIMLAKGIIICLTLYLETIPPYFSHEKHFWFKVFHTNLSIKIILFFKSPSNKLGMFFYKVLFFGFIWKVFWQ